MRSLDFTGSKFNNDLSFAKSCNKALIQKRKNAEKQNYHFVPESDLFPNGPESPVCIEDFSGAKPSFQMLLSDSKYVPSATFKYGEHVLNKFRNGEVPLCVFDSRDDDILAKEFTEENDLYRAKLKESPWSIRASSAGKTTAPLYLICKTPDCCAHGIANYNGENATKFIGVTEHSDFCEGPPDLLHPELGKLILKLLAENRPVAEIESECTRLAVTLTQGKANYRIEVTRSDLANRRRSMMAKRLDLDLKANPIANVHRLFSGNATKNSLDNHSFIYQPIDTTNDQFILGICTPEMKTFSWDLGHKKMLFVDGTFGVSKQKPAGSRGQIVAVLNYLEDDLKDPLVHEFCSYLRKYYVGRDTDSSINVKSLDDYLQEVELCEESLPFEDGSTLANDEDLEELTKNGFPLALQWCAEGRNEAAAVLGLNPFLIPRTNNHTEGYHSALKHKYLPDYCKNALLPRLDVLILMLMDLSRIKHDELVVSRLEASRRDKRKKLYDVQAVDPTRPLCYFEDSNPRQGSKPEALQVSLNFKAGSSGIVTECSAKVGKHSVTLIPQEKAGCDCLYFCTDGGFCAHLRACFHAINNTTQRKLRKIRILTKAELYYFFHGSDTPVPEYPLLNPVINPAELVGTAAGQVEEPDFPVNLFELDVPSGIPRRRKTEKHEPIKPVSTQIHQVHEERYQNCIKFFKEKYDADPEFVHVLEEFALTLREHPNQTSSRENGFEKDTKQRRKQSYGTKPTNIF